MRMKIQQGEFIGKAKAVLDDPKSEIEKVLRPFKPYIEKRQFKVSLMHQALYPYKHLIIADWSMYQLILFNVVQNAVKNNRFGSNLTVKT